MKYLYLVCEQLDGNVLISDIIDKFAFSLKSLYRVIPESLGNTFVFSSQPSEALELFCRDQNVTLQRIALSRNYLNTTLTRGGGVPYYSKLNILVEKIVMLRDFDPHQECVYIDLDTEVIGDFSPLLNDNAAFNCVEYTLISERNLGTVLPFLPYEDWGIRWDPGYKSYNAGLVFIPKSVRPELCTKAIHIVDFLNNGYFEGKDRVCNGLDEQIALSIVVQDRFGDKIIQVPQYLRHFWLQSILKAQGKENTEWWKE